MIFLSKHSLKHPPQDILLKYTILPLIPGFIKPNHLTILRFMLTPLVIIMFLFEWYAVGIPFFLMVALTDAVDGSLARSRKQITAWGKTYDPLADKFLIGSSLIIVAVKYFFWTTLTILLVELMFIFTGWSRSRRGIDISANGWGKAKMNFEVIGLVLLLTAIYFGLSLFFYFSLISLFLAIIFAVVSFFTFSI